MSGSNLTRGERIALASSLLEVPMESIAGFTIVAIPADPVNDVMVGSDACQPHTIVALSMAIVKLAMEIGNKDCDHDD